MDKNYKYLVKRKRKEKKIFREEEEDPLIEEPKEDNLVEEPYISLEESIMAEGEGEVYHDGQTQIGGGGEERPPLGGGRGGRRPPPRGGRGRIDGR